MPKKVVEVWLSVHFVTEKGESAVIDGTTVDRYLNITDWPCIPQVGDHHSVDEDHVLLIDSALHDRHNPRPQIVLTCSDHIDDLELYTAEEGWHKEIPS